MWTADTKKKTKRNKQEWSCIKYNQCDLKSNLRKNKHKHYLMSQQCFLFEGIMRCFQDKLLNLRGGNSKGVRKVGSDGNSEYSVCPLLLYPYGQLSVSQLSLRRGEVSAEELMSARWEHLHWAELKWMQRRDCLLPQRDTDFQQGNKGCWSRRLSQTEHESQVQPWHMMDTNAGREAASSSSLLSPCLLFFSFCGATDKQNPWRKREKGKEELMLELQWLPVELWPAVMCGLWCCPRCLERCREASKRTLLANQRIMACW